MTTPTGSNQATSTPVYAVILAGGSGTRFWPASRRTRPKQLLPLGPVAPRSLLRATVDRISPIVPKERVYILTGTHLVAEVARELPELESAAILAEPEAKNTAPCIAWATALIKKRDPEALVVVLPSDQHAADETGFRGALESALESAKSGRITTIGIVPTRPETGYGYIEAGGALEGRARAVRRFVEKPSLDVALEYLKSGKFVWNAGMFVYRASTLAAAFERHVPSLARGAEVLANFDPSTPAYADGVTQFFADAPSVSIDYAVMEKEQNLAVIPAEFGWSDLGSWESAWEASTRDEQGNSGPTGSLFIESAENLVQVTGPDANEKQVALVGVSGLCVVDTGDALLIIPKERSQDVRLVIDALKSSGRGRLL